MSSSSTLYLIDGNSSLYRNYHAIQPLSTSTGLPTNAVFGFARMIFKLLKEEKPEHLAVVFDAAAPTFRHELFEAYKAQRPRMPSDLAQQIPYVKRFITALNLTTVEIPGYEADDVIGTLAKSAEQRGVRVVILSPDKDLLQLISDNVQVVSERMGNRVVYDIEKVKERYGVEPAKIPDVLGLMGDQSDNVPGILGIGEKTAGKLIQEYGSVEELLRNADKVKNAKQRESLKEQGDVALKSKELVTLATDVPIEWNLQEFQVPSPNLSELIPLLQELEFNSILKEIAPEEKDESHTPKEYVAVLSALQLEELTNRLRTSTGFAVDTETTHQEPMRAKLAGISLSVQSHQAFYIPVGHTYPDAPKQLDINQVLSTLKPVLEDPRIPKYGQNIKYDKIVLAKYGVELQGLNFDTMIASYLLNPSRHTHNLEDITLEYLGHKRALTFNEVVGSGKDAITMDRALVEQVTRYSCEDVDLVFQLTEALRPRLQQKGLEELFHKVEMPLVEVLAQMERHGVRIDPNLLSTLSQELGRDIEKLGLEIYTLAGGEFNINSPKQLGEILFERLKLPVIRKTKTGYSTDVDVLEELAKGHPLPSRILEYRQLSKLKSTYVDTLPGLINPETGRIHTSYNQTVAATGRLSSSDPNLQNIPVRTPIGRRIRQAFIPAEGHLLLSADYSQIELRILAHLSGDEKLIEAFRHGEDIHTRTAIEVLGVKDPLQMTPELRRKAKAVNFGIIYGIGSFSLSKDLGISNSEAKQYIDNYFARYKGVKRYLDRMIEKARTEGFVTTLLNRIRYIPEIKSKDYSTRQFGERTATNTPIQGTAADMIKLAMIRIHHQLKEKFPDVKMILQVHDELVFEVSENQVESIKPLIREGMETILDMSVPINVDIYVGRNWDDRQASK
jgi:DNA polymerase-1